jgi:hypothetical protein
MFNTTKKEQINDKIYANSTLLEKEFKQLQPRKTRKGDRLFRAQDIEFLKQK